MRATFPSLISAAVLAGCNTKRPDELSPCETWKAAVGECAETAATTLDSGLFGDTGLEPEALVAAARCSADSADDPDWMQDLYTCYAEVYQRTDCSTTAGLLDISVQIADCGVFNGQ
ncbi:MAG: hypothetical protein CL927_00670 [Deltaproteobacteria bacterium]|nr:hypothetical protein [Deltaproteobacteria bacterium]|tara:strand:+ start:42 stop:392 length:351 start_codon:yes stop_codon:yes gene_type:complete